MKIELGFNAFDGKADDIIEILNSAEPDAEVTIIECRHYSEIERTSSGGAGRKHHMMSVLAFVT